MPGVHAERFNVQALERAGPEIELSVVMPCLNEAGTVGTLVEKVISTLREHGITGEVIVADNGSTDGSQAIAEDRGARVVHIEARGYSNALRGGITHARGNYVLVGDADGSYDFSHIPRFLERLRAGYDLVVGNRFKGSIAPGAMPFLHRYVGVPVLSAIARVLYRSPCGDHHCGLRAFRKSSFERLDLHAAGWEFNSEMIARACIFGLNICEVPTTLSPALRGRSSHLNTFSAGWQHLRTMLLYCPRFTFIYPGVLMMLLGLVAIILLIPGPRVVAGIRFNVITMAYAGTAVIVGSQGVMLGILARVYGISRGIFPENALLGKITRSSPLETGLILAAVLISIGVVGTALPLVSWTAQGFAFSSPLKILRALIPYMVCLAIGFQVALFSFFLSILRMR
jgi:glycosyltransferase involved in cell wall biosynthesis